MKKIYVVLAAVTGMTLASCTNSEFVGDVALTTPETGEGTAISFGGNAGKFTRATSNEGSVAEMLDGQFKAYGVKKVGDAYTGAFENYIFWNATTTTDSNPDGDWEYVGTADQEYGSDDPKATIKQNQTTKYWDYSAANYHFVAGSPVASFTYETDATTGDIKTAKVTGLAGHINANPSGTALVSNPVYIADPVNVVKKSTTGGLQYGDEVPFSFKRQQTFVRVGIYETISGYSISSIEFYTQGASGWVAPTGDDKNNVVLASATANYFSGSTNGTTTITYDWTTTPASYTFEYSGLTQAKNWYGGKFAAGVPAIISTESDVDKLYGTDKDMASNGYFTVLPSATASSAQPILIKCNYVLTADDGKGETITVTGATAAIPSAFTLWKANTTYTYLFKISQNTNGSTGNPDDPDNPDPQGLFPITFDAVVETSTDMVEGIITSVETPNITTYQDGSVTATGIEYKKDTPIYFTAQDDKTGALFTLTTGGSAVSNVQVYKLAGAATEADLQLKAPTTTVTTTLVSDATAVGSWTIPSGAAYFTPDAAGYYAIQYQTKVATTSDGPAAYTYKVIYVK